MHEFVTRANHIILTIVLNRMTLLWRPVVSVFRYRRLIVTPFDYFPWTRNSEVTKQRR